jgi:hypothetical protein
MGRRVRISARVARVLATLGLAALGLVGAALADDAQKPRKPKRPGFELRVSPRFSFSPAELMFTAELKGGDDMEEYYCPEVEWEWGDGGKSVQEADCDPWKPDTRLERRFISHHLFPDSGIYQTRVTLRKSDRTIAIQTIEVTVRPGLGDRNMAMPE